MGIERLNDLDALFNESINEAIEKAKVFNEVDVVIGIPFYNEKNILPEVLKVLDEGLADLKDTSKALIVCVGDPVGTETLESIRRLDLRAPHLEFLMKPGSNGRGASAFAAPVTRNRIHRRSVVRP